MSCGLVVIRSRCFGSNYSRTLAKLSAVYAVPAGLPLLQRLAHQVVSQGTSRLLIHTSLTPHKQEEALDPISRQGLLPCSGHWQQTHGLLRMALGEDEARWLFKGWGALGLKSWKGAGVEAFRPYEWLNPRLVGSGFDLVPSDSHEDLERFQSYRRCFVRCSGLSPFVQRL